MQGGCFIKCLEYLTSRHPRAPFCITFIATSSQGWRWHCAPGVVTAERISSEWFRQYVRSRPSLQLPSARMNVGCGIFPLTAVPLLLGSTLPLLPSPGMSLSFLCMSLLLVRVHAALTLRPLAQAKDRHPCSTCRYSRPDGTASFFAHCVL